MKKIIKILLSGFSIPTSIVAGSFATISCSNKSETIVLFDTDKNVKVNSVQVGDNLQLEITVNQNFALDESESYVSFNKESESKKVLLDSKEFLKYSPNVWKNKIIVPMQSCDNISVYLRTISLESWGNRYTEKHQSNFWENLTVVSHDYTTTNNLYCSSQAEGVYMYTYGPGYSVWNTYLHEGKESEMGDIDVNVGSFSFPSAEAPRSLDKTITRKNLPIKLKDFKYIDDGLKLSTAGLELNVYHGLETNETELISFLNNLLNFDIKDGNPEEARKIDLSIVNNTSYINKGWCATSLDKYFALDWASRWSAEFKNSPVLDITLDPNVCCAYVSYTNKKYFNTYLAWPHEYQILTQRNLKFTFSSGEWIKKDDGDNILYLKCRASLA